MALRSAGPAGAKAPNTFYTTITPVKEDFVDATGRPGSVDLPLVTLPAGTVLFRGIRLPNEEAGEDVRYVYRDFLGDPEGPSSVCLSPTHNVFFYPIPNVMFGAHQIGSTFQAVQVVVLVHPVTVVSSISPSAWVRGITNRFGGTAPYQKCSTVASDRCHPLTEKEQKALGYDNCLSPAYQVKSGTRGWMAIADLDSVNPSKLGVGMKDSPMGRYIKDADTRKPGEAASLISNLYADANRHMGYPEIALYPYRTHNGNSLITRSFPKGAERRAMSFLAKEAAADNLNYLPIATITKDGVIDMIGGHFTYSRMALAKNIFTMSGPEQQPAIEAHLRTYMETLETVGTSFPHYGNGRLSFDTRTGFYAFPQIVRGTRIPTSAAAAGAGLPYEQLLLPLSNEEAKRRALTYALTFRTFMPQKFMEKEEKLGFTRAMIFSRPPVLTKVFEELEIPMPAAFSSILGRAAGIFKRNTMVPLAQAKGTVAASAAKGTVAAGQGQAKAASLKKSPLASASTSTSLAALPPRHPIAEPVPAAFGSLLNAEPYSPPQAPYVAAQAPYVASQAPYSPAQAPYSPPQVPYVPPTAPPKPTNPALPPWLQGGYRKTRSASRRSKRKTRRMKGGNLAALFATVWKSHSIQKNNS